MRTTTATLPDGVTVLAEDLFPDGRTVLTATRGITLGPDVSTTFGPWCAVVVALPLTTGVRFELEATDGADGQGFASLFARDVELAHTPTDPADLAALFHTHGPALLAALDDHAATGDLTLRDTLAAAVRMLPASPHPALAG